MNTFAIFTRSDGDPIRIVGPFSSVEDARSFIRKELEKENVSQSDMQEFNIFDEVTGLTSPESISTYGWYIRTGEP